MTSSIQRLSAVGLEEIGELADVLMTMTKARDDLAPTKKEEGNAEDKKEYKKGLIGIQGMSAAKSHQKVIRLGIKTLIVNLKRLFQVEKSARSGFLYVDSRDKFIRLEII